MLNRAENDATQRALQKRIQELEQENFRLSRELDEKKRGQALYRMLVDNLPIGSAFLVDHDLRYLLAVGQALQATGMTSRDFIGKTIREALGAETAASLEPNYRKVLSGEIFVMEHRDRDRDYITRGVPVYDMQGKIAAALALSYDITERKKLENSLYESENRFRTMADSAPMIIWVTNAAGEIEFTNKAWTEYFDLTMDQIQDMGWQMLIHPDDQFGYVEEYSFCLKQRKPFHAQARVYRKDGQWRWVVSYAQPRFSNDGKFLGMTGSHLDITERVEAEEALAESELKFHSAFENAAIGFAMATPDGCFVDVNAAYCELTGYSKEELLKIQYFQLIHPDDVEHNIELTGQLLAQEIPYYVIENRYIRKDGQPVWVRKSISVVSSPAGDPKWTLALVEDINEQKKAEEARRQSERIYRAIGEAIPYGVWVCDPDGRNIYASQSYLDLVGITQEQCSEFGWGDTLHPDDRERTMAAWKECVRTEGVWDIEHRFLGTDGQYHPILARGIPVRDEENKIICWAGINLDISGLKRNEPEL